MKLSEKRFFVFDCLVSDKDGKQHPAVMYGYESEQAIYDVLVITKAWNDKETVYKTNLKVSDKTKYHEAVEKYYHLNGGA